MRFALLDSDHVQTFELLRHKVASMSEAEILSAIEKNFGILRKEIELIAVTYSMGDGFSAIEDLRKLQHRGLQSTEGAGKKREEGQGSSTRS